MLGHSMRTLHLYKILCKVQKHLGGCGTTLLWNFTAFQVSFEAIVLYIANFRTTFVILWMYVVILHHLISRTFGT